MMQHDEIKDLVAAYALDAVEPGERREIEAHLETCDECREELAAYQDATATMALAVEDAPLPAGFTDRVVDAAVGERSSVRRVQRWRKVAIVMSAAVVAASIAVAGTVLEARNDSERRREVLALLQSSDGIALSGDESVTARIVPAEDGSRFAIAGVDSAPNGKTYQLWLMRGESCPSAEPAECELVSAGTFDTEDETAILDLDHNIGEWEDAAVSLEPEDGSDFPSTTPFASSL